MSIYNTLRKKKGKIFMHYAVGVITKNESIVEIHNLMYPFGGTSGRFDWFKFKNKEQFIKGAREIFRTMMRSADYLDYKNGHGVIWYQEELFPEIKQVLAMNDEDFFIRACKHYEIEPFQFGENGKFIAKPPVPTRYDWYVVGGRFAKSLRTKNKMTTSCARLKDIDFTLSPEEVARYADYWDRRVDGVEHSSVDNPIVFGGNKEYLLANFKNKEDYIYQTLFPIPSHLLTHEGKWFGVATPDYVKEGAISREDYNAIVFEMVKKYPDYYYTVVDCHV